MIRELYRVADALLFPSAQEGFGLPVLEAGLARLPAFCADIEPFRAIAGENLHYFDLNEDPTLTAHRLLETLNQHAEVGYIARRWANMTGRRYLSSSSCRW